jgi:beta-galactosidase
LIGTETASTLSTRGIYETDKERGYITAYDTYKPDWGDLAEDWWTFYDEREWLAGGFLWTGFDYRGETTPYKWPCISSHFGVMDTCGFPKDNYFYYQAWWSGKPVLHILPHWNWPGKEGQEIEVWVYCNQESVELFLNDKSLGSKAVRKNGHLVWKVKYQPGTLLAKGKKSGKVLIEERAETVGTPAKILLHPDRTTLAADGQDCLPINVTVVDAQGRVVPTANNLLTFKVSGAGNVIGLGNGDPSCHEPDKPGDDAARRSVFNGLAQVIVQASKHAGELTVQATSPRLESATVTVAVEGPK